MSCAARAAAIRSSDTRPAESTAAYPSRISRALQALEVFRKVEAADRVGATAALITSPWPPGRWSASRSDVREMKRLSARHCSTTISSPVSWRVRISSATARYACSLRTAPLVGRLFGEVSASDAEATTIVYADCGVAGMPQTRAATRQDHGNGPAPRGDDRRRNDRPRDLGAVHPLVRPVPRGETTAHWSAEAPVQKPARARRRRPHPTFANEGMRQPSGVVVVQKNSVEACRDVAMAGAVQVLPLATAASAPSRPLRR